MKAEEEYNALFKKRGPLKLPLLRRGLGGFDFLACKQTGLKAEIKMDYKKTLLPTGPTPSGEKF